MLQHPGTGHRSFLRHMAHNKYGNPLFLCQTHQYSGGFTDLRDASGCGRDRLLVHGLYGINDHRLRLFPEDNFFNIWQICLAQKLERFLKVPDAQSTQPDLLQRFLSGYIEKILHPLRQIPAHLQKQRGLSDSRISSYQNQGAGYDPAAQHLVQFCHSGGNPLLLPGWNAGKTDRTASGPSLTVPAGGRSPGLSCLWFFYEGIPFVACRTLSWPFGWFISAVLTEEYHTALFHAGSSGRTVTRTLPFTTFTSTWLPSGICPFRISSASTSSSRFWITRLRGLAPYFTSYPVSASHFLTESLKDTRMESWR